MKIGSDCSGECLDCRTYYTGYCLAGHGDDDFTCVDSELAKKVLAEGVISKGMDGPLYKERPLSQEEIYHLTQALEK